MKPTHVKMQYAGGMGVLSTGVGWDYGKRRQWETDVLLGYLPAKYASDFLLTLTVKQNYIPWSMSFDKHWALGAFLLRNVSYHHCRRRVLEEGTRTLS